MTGTHTWIISRVPKLTLAATLLVPALTSCAAGPADVTDEMSGNVAIVANVDDKGNVTSSSHALTTAESAEQTGFWTEAAVYLEDARNGRAAWGPGAFEQWADANGSPALRQTISKALASESKALATEKKKGSIGAVSQALTAANACVNDGNCCYLALMWGMLDLAVWDGANYTGNYACFIGDSTVHLHLPSFSGGLFHGNIRALQTYNRGVQTMTNGGAHYAAFDNTMPVANAPIDYRIDPYLHGNL